VKISITRADALFSLLVRERAEHRCERCGRTDGKLDCSHIEPRGTMILRFDPANAMCLCFRCHRWWHANPAESGVWCRNVIGEERYAYLLAKKMERFKFDSAMKAHVRKNLQWSWDEMQGCRESGVTGRIEFSNPYLGQVAPLAKRPKKAKKKAGPKKRIQSRPLTDPNFKQTLRRGVVPRKDAA
jgi:hypothetical protein